MELLDQDGLAFASRWLHVLSGITWIGLLYYFNFVQVPAFAQMEPGPRTAALDKIARRALWWFRWAAVATVVMGLLITGFTEDYYDEFFDRPNGASIFVGMIYGLIMFANVWLVIWPNQKILLANAAGVLNGQPALPQVPAATRAGALASRQNVMLSIPMVWFMLATSHFYSPITEEVSSGKIWTFIIIALVIAALLELNALGVIAGRDPGPLKWPYESVQNVLISGFVLWAILWILSEILLFD